MDQNTPPPANQAAFAIPRWEFIAIAAGLMALNALATDIMLPALQEMGAALGVEKSATAAAIAKAPPKTPLSTAFIRHTFS